MNLNDELLFYGIMVCIIIRYVNDIYNDGC